MFISRIVVVVALGLLLSSAVPQAEGRAGYRGFQLGATVQSVVALVKMPGMEARTVHQRPALLQTLEWRPAFFASRFAEQQKDPVQQVVFSFYEDQLYSIVVDYDRDRTDGMTSADVIEAMRESYGPPSSAAVNKTAAVKNQWESESGTPVARWSEAEDSVVVLYQSSDLYRSSGVSRFRLVITSPRLEALSRTAAAQALRLDEREAPQRESARQKKEMEALRESQEKARFANRAAFRP
jgi:hypothetical protein